MQIEWYQVDQLCDLLHIEFVFDVLLCDVIVCFGIKFYDMVYSDVCMLC